MKSSPFVLSLFYGASSAFLIHGKVARKPTVHSALSRREAIASAMGVVLPTVIPRSSNAADGQIEKCTRTADGSPSNCVSTASVRQVDLNMSPWTYPDDMAPVEVMGRLKGALKNAEIEVSKDTYLLAKARRGLGIVDQLEFVVNESDHVVFFSSRQVDGPNANDLGANRKRLEDIRLRTGFRIMGEEYERPREGALGQLKAFYGLQSGAGFEDVVLDIDR
jgi:uncharacterized protein (DUF1499 family)